MSHNENQGVVTMSFVKNSLTFLHNNNLGNIVIEIVREEGETTTLLHRTTHICEKI